MKTSNFYFFNWSSHGMDSETLNLILLKDSFLKKE